MMEVEYIKHYSIKPKYVLFGVNTMFYLSCLIILLSKPAFSQQNTMTVSLQLAPSFDNLDQTGKRLFYHLKNGGWP